MPPHIFSTKYLGLVEILLCTSFAHFSRAHGLFSISASVQAIHVSTRDKWGEAKVPPFLGGSPLFYIKHPQDNSQPPNCKLPPPKYRLARGSPIPFGGCQFTFWRLKLSWGCFIEKATCPLHFLFPEIFLCKAELSRDFEYVVLCAPKSAANSRIVVLCAPKSAAISRP